MAAGGDETIIPERTPDRCDCPPLADFRSIREYYERFGNPVDVFFHVDSTHLEHITAVCAGEHATRS